MKEGCILKKNSYLVSNLGDINTIEAQECHMFGVRISWDFRVV